GPRPRPARVGAASRIRPGGPRPVPARPVPEPVQRGRPGLLPTGVPGRARPGRPTAALAARPPGRRRGRLAGRLAVGLGWLARFEPAGPGETTLVWYGVLVVAMRATACRAGPGAGARPPRPPARPVPAGRPGRPGRRRPAGAGLVDDHPGRHQL